MDLFHFLPNLVRREVAQVVACLLALGLGGLPLAARTVRYPSSRDGIKMEITPSPHDVAVVATVTNRGRVNASLVHGGPLGVWRLFVFDATGKPIQATPVARLRVPSRISTHALKPGMAANKHFSLRQYVAGARRGTFYVYVERYIGVPSGKFTDFSIFRSPILRVSIHPGMLPQWKYVQSVHRYGQPGVTRASPAPPFPPNQIPVTGPIATLTQIAAAVERRNLAAARKLCYQGHHLPEPFYVAFAARAIAAQGCTTLVEKRFGVNPWPHLVPSPEVFLHILQRLNPKSLRINGDKAIVGVLWYNKGKFIPFPSFAYHFRKVHSRWLLDSWATQMSVPRASATSYQLNVENSLREAAAFDGLARDVAAGKFASFHAFKISARQRMAAVDDWFMVQSMKGNKQWMKANTWLVKRVEQQAKVAKKHVAQTQP